MHFAWQTRHRDAFAWTLEVHTLELARYNIKEAELRSATTLWTAGYTGCGTPTSTSPRDCLNCFRSRQYASDGDAGRHFRNHEDKVMYDARERATS